MRQEQHTSTKAGWHDLDQLVAEAYDLLEREPETLPEVREASALPPELDGEAAIQAAIIAALGRSADPRGLLAGLIAGMPPPSAPEVSDVPLEGEAGPGESGDV